MIVFMVKTQNHSILCKIEKLYFCLLSWCSLLTWNLDKIITAKLDQIIVEIGTYALISFKIKILNLYRYSK